MNMKIFNFVEVIMNLFTNWLSCDEEKFAWCPVKVDNRINRY